MTDLVLGLTFLYLFNLLLAFLVSPGRLLGTIELGAVDLLCSFREFLMVLHKLEIGQFEF